MKILNKLIVLFALIPLISSCRTLLNMSIDSDVYFCEYRGGFWGEWSRSIMFCTAKGSVGNFVLYPDSVHPSEWGTRVYVNGLNDLKQLKKGEWYEYSGTIEYYSTKSTLALAIEDLVRNAISCHVRPVSGNLFSIPATIKVRKGTGRIVYNILFDNVGIGIQLPLFY